MEANIKRKQETKKRIDEAAKAEAEAKIKAEEEASKLK